MSRIRRPISVQVALLVILLAMNSARADDLDKQRCPKPADFALVFSFGYAGDHMPADDAAFEKLLRNIKIGGFNVVHCTFTDKRLELCKKHGIKMMIDLLAEQHHVYKTADKAQAVCMKLRGHPDVWGYNIWNDPFGKSAPGRVRDVSAVRQWDPTHPAYCGTYRNYGMSQLTNPDVMGYYDFHWKRGIGQHFPHLLAFSNWSKERDAWFYTWLSATSGQAGAGNFNRSLYSANTGIACGLKGLLWFLATDLMNAKTLEWTTRGQDIIKVNKEILPLSKELMQLGMPTAIYSTPITRSANNEPIPDPKTHAMPPGLAGREFPKDFWLQPAGGEFVAGFFKDGQKRHTVFIANNNAYVVQNVVLNVSGKGVAIRCFDRGEGKWRPLELSEGMVRFNLAPGGGELLQITC